VPFGLNLSFGAKAAFACGFLIKKPANRATGRKKNKNIRVSHVVSEDPTLITTCLLVDFN
jgi:hypothetical protein